MVNKFKDCKLIRNMWPKVTKKCCNYDIMLGGKNLLEKMFSLNLIYCVGFHFFAKFHPLAAKTLAKEINKVWWLSQVIKIKKGIENVLVSTRKMMPLAKETKMFGSFMNFSLCLKIKVFSLLCVWVWIEEDVKKISHDFKFNNQIKNF